MQSPRHHAARGKRRVEFVDGVVGAGGDAELRSIDRREREVAAQKRRQLRLGEPNGHHRAARHLLHQTAAGGDKAKRILMGEYAGDAGRDELADAVADHHLRRDAKAAPKSGQRITDSEEGGLRDLRRLKRVRGQTLALVAVKQRAEIGAKRRTQDLGAAAHALGENRFGLEKAHPHRRILRALPRKHEGERSRRARLARRQALPRLQRRHR